jgi:hypothetical protein
MRCGYAPHPCEIWASPGRPVREKAPALASVVMPMMNIRIVRMSVFDRLVRMDVGMGLLATPVGVVLMLVMGVMDV